MTEDDRRAQLTGDRAQPNQPGWVKSVGTCTVRSGFNPSSPSVVATPIAGIRNDTGATGSPTEAALTEPAGGTGPVADGVSGRGCRATGPGINAPTAVAPGAPTGWAAAGENACGSASCTEVGAAASARAP